jgi:Calcineurin-like phosphoesterase
VSASVPLGTQTVVIETYLELLAARTRVVACSGNHDLTDEDDGGERSAPWLSAARRLGVLVDGESEDLEGTLITVCPWWDGPKQREAVARRLEEDSARQVRPWIWVYHWPPAGSSTTWTGRDFYGDEELSGWIDELRPDLVLCGHVHQPPFQAEGSWVDRIGSTWVFNAGRQIGPEPSHVVVDLDEGVATWTSLLGVESQDLSRQPDRPRPLFS